MCQVLVLRFGRKETWNSHLGEETKEKCLKQNGFFPTKGEGWNQTSNGFLFLHCPGLQDGFFWGRWPLQNQNTNHLSSVLPLCPNKLTGCRFCRGTRLRVATSRPRSCHCLILFKWHFSKWRFVAKIPVFGTWPTFHLQVFNVWWKKHVKLKTEKESMEMRQEAYD